MILSSLQALHNAGSIAMPPCRSRPGATHPLPSGAGTPFGLLKVLPLGAVGTLRGGSDEDETSDETSLAASADSDSSDEEEGESESDSEDGSSEPAADDAQGVAIGGGAGVRGPVVASCGSGDAAGLEGEVAGVPAKHQAAFGIPVPSERAAGKLPG